MPSGIILQSGSIGATQEAVEKVLIENGHEPERPVEVAPVEPKREDFESEEAFTVAQEEFEAKQDEAEEKAAEEEERKRLESLPKKSRKQQAVEKATKELRDENRKLAERIAALEGKKSPEAAKIEEPKAPKREDFKSDAEYDDALFDYRYKLRRLKEEQEQARTAVESKLKQNFTDYQTSAAAFKKEHDDWDEIVGQSIAIPEAVYYAIVDLGKDGPAVTYHLGHHPEILGDLAELTPYRAAIEVGRLADKLAKGKKPGAERTPKPAPKRIPEPVRPVSTSATTSTLTSREAAHKRDFRAFKAAQRRGA